MRDASRAPGAGFDAAPEGDVTAVACAATALFVTAAGCGSSPLRDPKRYA